MIGNVFLGAAVGFVFGSLVLAIKDAMPPMQPRPCVVRHNGRILRGPSSVN